MKSKRRMNIIIPRQISKIQTKSYCSHQIKKKRSQTRQIFGFQVNVNKQHSQ